MFVKLGINAPMFHVRHTCNRLLSPARMISTLETFLTNGVAGCVNSESYGIYQPHNLCLWEIHVAGHGMRHEIPFEGFFEGFFICPDLDHGLFRKI